MNGLINLIPHDQLIYAAIAIFLPTIAGFLVYLKSQKDGIVGFVVDEIDDVLADLNAAKVHVVEALSFAEDAIEGLYEGLGADSPGGAKLTDEEKAESLAVANQALAQLKAAKNKIMESVLLND